MKLKIIVFANIKIIIYINFIVKNIMNVNMPSSLLSLIMPFVVQWEMKSDVETAA